MPRLFLQTAMWTLAAISIACAPERPDDRYRAHEAEGPNTDVALVVDGEPISLQEFQRRIERLPPWGQARFGTADARQAHLFAVADFELLADEAVRQGYEADPRVVDHVKRAVASEERRRREGSGEGMPDRTKAGTTVDDAVLQRVVTNPETK